MDNIVIRECRSDDLEFVLELQQELAKEDIIYGFVPSVKEELESKLGSYFLIAELDNLVVGFCYGSINESEGLAVIPKGERYLEVEDVYVKPELRDQEVGGKLFDRLIEVANKESVERVLVYSASKDTDRILQFYRRHGLKPWYVQMFK